MAQNNTKIVQAFVESVKEVADLVILADAKAQAYKAKWVALNPSLTGTSLTSGQVTAVNNWITSLNDVRNSAVVSTVQTKTQPSHGVEALN